MADQDPSFVNPSLFGVQMSDFASDKSLRLRRFSMPYWSHPSILSTFTEEFGACLLGDMVGVGMCLTLLGDRI